MKKTIIAVLLTISIVTCMSGCAKVIEIGTESKYTGQVAFDAGSSVTEMWDAVLEDISNRAVELPDFLKEANGDLSSVVDKYGQYSMGTSGTISYPVKGTGTVTLVENTKKAGYMTVKLDNYDGPETVNIQIGSIYKGSSTRDSLKIIKFGDYTNQEEWGAISISLHKLIDSNVVKSADPASLKDKKIEFTGTFTVDGNDKLLITPVKLTAK